MAKLTNHTRKPVELATGHVIEAGETLETTMDVVRHVDNVPYLSGLELSGRMTIERDPDKPSIDAITRMTVGELRKLLKDFGESAPSRDTVAVLRSKAVNLLHGNV